MQMRGLLVLMAAGMLLPALAWGAPSINEIMADPASDWDGDGVYDFKDDEWVEICNPGPGHVALEEYMLSDDEGLWTFGFEAGEVLAAGETRVLYGSESVAWQDVHGEPKYGFKMSNDGDTVLLWQVAGTDTVLVDSRTFNTYEADDDRSTGRNPDALGDWEIFDALNPYSGTTPPLGNGLAPTPGRPNDGSTPPVIVHQESWGDVKGLFR